MENYSRRNFIKTAGASSLAAAALPGMLMGQMTAKPKKDLIWANLIHLSMNMWEDWQAPGKEARYYRPYLWFDEKLWNDLLIKMAENRLNMVILDLGNGVHYKSHPEITVKNAWSVGKLKEEIARMREMGLEPVPKLNFSSGHDAWLKEYSRCLSTKLYYEVCADLIAEVCDIFDTPRFFHLGMDEETARHQRTYQYVVVRQYDTWWHDFMFLYDEVKKGGSRPWIWSDYLWDNPEPFFEKMPKDVLQSNWYYSLKFGEDDKMVQAYRKLEEHGYDQVPTGSNHGFSENFGMTVDYCKKYISPEHLKGFMQTPWRATVEQYRQHHMEAIEQVGAAIAANS